MFDFPSKNNLLSPNQSRFRPGDSCIIKLLSINHKILSTFDMGPEIRGIFLDISKAFDKLWHDGLIFKPRQNGIYSERIKFFRGLPQRQKAKSRFKWSVLVLG